MTPDELITRATKMFGRRWKVRLAEELGMHITAIYRWIPKRNGSPAQLPVPGYVDVWFELQESRRKIERFAKSLTK